MAEIRNLEFTTDPTMVVVDRGPWTVKENYGNKGVTYFRERVPTLEFRRKQGRAPESLTVYTYADRLHVGTFDANSPLNSQLMRERLSATAMKAPEDAPRALLLYVVLVGLHLQAGGMLWTPPGDTAIPGGYVSFDRAEMKAALGFNPRESLDVLIEADLLTATPERDRYMLEDSPLIRAVVNTRSTTTSSTTDPNHGMKTEAAIAAALAGTPTFVPHTTSEISIVAAPDPDGEDLAEAFSEALGS